VNLASYPRARAFPESPPERPPEPPAIDVSDLPTTAPGSRTPLWWGVVGMITIESTIFAMLAVTYFYLRGGASVWPPADVAPNLLLRGVELGILLASAVPMIAVELAVKRRSLAGMRLWLGIATLLGLAFVALRFYQFHAMTFRWNSHAYGSIVWTILGMHTTHSIAASVENIVFMVLLFVGPLEERHLLDLRLNALYWYFVVLAWVPLFAILYLDPGLLGAVR
jgi:heme/copper-type cytochrome/quinol oxidase subunit 3